MSEHKLAVATRRLTLFGDEEAMLAVGPLASSILRDATRHNVTTLRLAAQAVVLGELLQGGEFICETGKECGVSLICGSNKVLRNKDAAHAQWPVQCCHGCGERECNLNASYEPPPIVAAEHVLETKEYLQIIHG